jgi:tRNA pseudouridine55 synthase
MSEMSGVFAINKPSGIASAKFLSKVQEIFTNSPNFSGHLSKLQGEKVKEIQKNGGKASRRKLRSVLKVKMGHGGTLDPLASGVLVIGVNQGTKKLQNYLNGSIKTYETEALFGYSTTTGDVEGEILTKTGVKHITKEQVSEIPSKFIGDLRQTPPIFAALKMNGKPLYEYARENIPLPKEIKSRLVKVYSLDVFDDTLSYDHQYDKLSDSEMIQELSKNPTLNENKLYFSKQYMESIGKNEEEPIEVGLTEPFEEQEKLPLLHFKAQVSSGTYIRSLISDVGKSVGSSAYMVKLIREQQAEWVLGKNVLELEDFLNRPHEVWGKVLSQVFEKGGEEISDIKSLFQEAEEEFKLKQLTAENTAEEKSDETSNVAGIIDESTQGSEILSTEIEEAKVDGVQQPNQQTQSEQEDTEQPASKKRKFEDEEANPTNAK